MGRAFTLMGRVFIYVDLYKVMIHNLDVYDISPKVNSILNKDPYYVYLTSFRMSFPTKLVIIVKTLHYLEMVLASWDCSI